MFDFFYTKGFKNYVKQAQKILDGNWTGRYTGRKTCFLDQSVQYYCGAGDCGIGIGFLGAGDDQFLHTHLL